MAKNRRVTYSKGPERKKKRPYDSNNTSRESSPKNERNLLNDGILKLYKNDLEKLTQQKSNDQKLDTKSPGNVKESMKLPNSNDTVMTFSNTPKKLKKKVSSVKNPTVTFNDIGGLDEEIGFIIGQFLHLKFSNLLISAHSRPSRGLLLHGPPGCGKTLLAEAIAGSLEMPLLQVDISSLLHSTSGASISNLKDCFDEAMLTAPCILFIDQIDAISGSRDTPERSMEVRMAQQLMQCFDELNSKDPTVQVIVIGATNRIESIDQMFRRGGRFEEEIALKFPNENGRLKILEILCNDLPLASDCDLKWLAEITPGFCGADLKAVVSGAIRLAKERFFRSVHDFNQDSIPEGNQNKQFTYGSLSKDEGMSLWNSSVNIKDSEHNLHLIKLDFEKSIRNYTPCTKREGYPSVPNVTWNDVGALHEARKVIESSILRPVRYREIFETYCMQSVAGILLCGPKGCGKTLLAKAVANEARINFLSVRGPELLNMYLGESERSVRLCFQRARNAAPCLIFFDEIDALCSARSTSNVNAAPDRVVTQLLTEMEGVEDRKQVFVMAATNRPEKIDSAMLRPGRLDRVLFVDLPTGSERVEILKSLSKDKTKPPIAQDLDLETIAHDPRCEGFSGADLSYLLRETFSFAFEDYLNLSQSEQEGQSIEVHLNHFDKAFAVVKPSVSQQERQEVKDNFLNIRGLLQR